MRVQSELPLIVSAAPKNGESILGLIARATAENALVKPSILFEHLGIHRPWSFLIRYADDDVIKWISDKLGCRSSQIKSLIADITLGENSVLRPGDVAIRLRRISPTSLAGSNYHRVSWCNALLPFCPESFELLVSSCQCGAELKWFAALGIGTCESCFSTVAPSSKFLPEDERESYRKFAGLWSPSPKERAAARVNLAPRLQQMHPTALAELALILGVAITGISRKNLERMSVFDAACAQASINTVGFDNLQSWPQVFRQTIKTLSKDESAAEIGYVKMFRRLDPLIRYDHSGTKGARVGQIASVVLEAAPEISMPLNRGVRSLREGEFSVAAYKKIGIRSDEINKIRKAGLLSFTPTFASPGTSKALGVYSAAEVDELAKRRRNSIRGDSTSTRLGVPVYAVEQLAQIGLIQAEVSPALLLIEPMRIVLASIDGFKADLDKVVQRGRIPEGAKSLRSALQAIGGGEKPWAAIASALISGNLPCWFEGNDIQMRTLKIMPEELHFVEPLSNPNPPKRVFDGYSQLEALELLNCKRARLSQVPFEALPFERIGKGQSVPRPKLMACARDAISEGEIGARLSKHSFAVRRLMKGLPFIPKNALGWDRTVVERHVAPPRYPNLMPL